MRGARRLLLVLALVVVACERTTAETLDTPFPGEVLHASSVQRRCGNEGCYTRYRVRVTDPTDRDANVQRCRVDVGAFNELDGVELWFGFPAGVGIRAHETVTTGNSSYLKIDVEQIKQLRGLPLTCWGIDWHGNPPI
jgi:hypothetical protein